METSETEEKSTEELALDLYREYGSWERAGRRAGVSKDLLRQHVKHNTEVSERTREKLEAARRLIDLKRFVGLDAIALAMQAVSAMNEAEDDTLRQKQHDRAMERLNEMHHLLQVGNIDEIQDEICDC